jgi:hypothetical protein
MARSKRAHASGSNSNFLEGFLAMTKYSIQNLMNSTNDDGPYYEAIGRFIVTYAGAESITHELFRKLSGIKDAKARALFGGIRLGEATNKIQVLLRISKRSPSSIKDIESCLTQLDVIGRQRDKMVHRHLHYHEGAVHIHNQMTAKSALSFEQDRFSMDDLLRLQLDCLTIILRLTHIVYPAFKKVAIKMDLKALHEPWRYKPPAPQNKKRRTAIQTVAEALQRQRQPSRK